MDAEELIFVVENDGRSENKKRIGDGICRSFRKASQNNKTCLVSETSVYFPGSVSDHSNRSGIWRDVPVQWQSMDRNSTAGKEGKADEWIYFMPDKKSRRFRIISRISAQTYIPWRNFAIIFIIIFILLIETILNEESVQMASGRTGASRIWQLKLRPALCENLPAWKIFLYPVFKEINYLTYEEMKSSEHAGYAEAGTKKVLFSGKSKKAMNW